LQDSTQNCDNNRVLIDHWQFAASAHGSKWHKADIPRCLLFARFRGEAYMNRQATLVESVENDPLTNVAQLFWCAFANRSP